MSVNLIARGEGLLDVARQLVSKSFAMWEKRQVEERINAAVETHGEGLGNFMVASVQERFMDLLQEILEIQVNRKREKFGIARIESILEVFDDKELLKKTSKRFLSTTKILELEKSTLSYLEKELESTNVDELSDDVYAEMVQEDRISLMEQIEAQQDRVAGFSKEIYNHPFSAIARVANEIIMEDTPESVVLLDALRKAKAKTTAGTVTELTAADLSMFAKSAIVVRRKARKLANTNPGVDPQHLVQQAENADVIKDGSWDDMLAIIKTLVDYGCIEVADGILEGKEAWEKATYSVTPAGMNVGMLGFDNSLWTLVAMGGAWDVAGASSNLDRFHQAMKSLESNGDEEEDEDHWYDDDSEDESRDERESNHASVAQKEAEELLSLIRTMTPAELAGYVAAIMSEGSRMGGPSVVELFHNLTPLQQRVVQSSLQCMERLAEVQRLNNVDPGTRQTNLDISNVQVVTAWADGCSWNEALRLSGGAPPGDLARTLSRALDAVRQLGNLPFTPVRKEDLETNSGGRRASRGLHPDVRRLCRDAATAINRYPLKDPFSFEEAADVNEEDDAGAADVDEES